MFIQESDRSFVLCIPGPGPGQCNILQFFVRARADLVYVARQGCATSRLIHEPCSTESQVVLIFWHPLVH